MVCVVDVFFVADIVVVSVVLVAVVVSVVLVVAVVVVVILGHTSGFQTGVQFVVTSLYTLFLASALILIPV